MHTRLPLFLMALLPALAGCPVTQSQRTPVQQFRQVDPVTGVSYWLYVPSYYGGDRSWPLVITLHGTHGFDNDTMQIKEWKALAEEKGFLVAAPSLKSPQGILPVSSGSRFKDLEADERTILACLRSIRRRYDVAPDAVLLTGFSAGGYAMYYTGLRNPEEFSALIARACNSDLRIFESITVTEAVRNLPVVIIHGKDDLGPIGDQSWAAYRWLREHRCFKAEHVKIEGGHIRQPGVAWERWQKHLPPQFRKID